MIEYNLSGSDEGELQKRHLREGEIYAGIDNLKGNIDSVHRYNRRRITEETRPKYGKLIGISTLICAGSVILCAILDLVCGELPEIGSVAQTV